MYKHFVIIWASILSVSAELIFILSHSINDSSAFLLTISPVK